MTDSELNGSNHSPIVLKFFVSVILIYYCCCQMFKVATFSKDLLAVFIRVL
jgi:hypothetical protein